MSQPTMSRYAAVKDINHAVVPKMTTELLEGVSAGVDNVNSSLFGGNDPATVVRDIRNIANRKVLRTITSFKESEFYWCEDSEYSLKMTKNFRLVRYQGQTVDVINDGAESIKVYVFSKSSTGYIKQKTVYVPAFSMQTFH